MKVYNILSILVLVSVLCSIQVSAWELNPFADTKTSVKEIPIDTTPFLKEKFNPEYGMITINSNFMWIENGKVAQYTLTDKIESVVNLKMLGRAVTYEDGTLFDNVEFINSIGGYTSLRDYKYYIKVKEEYEESTPQYKTTCSGTKKDLLTGKEVEDCKDVLVDTIIETKTREVWKEYKGERLVAGEYEWMFEAQRDIGQKVDIQPVKNNINFNEWVWFNNSWTKCKPMNITGGATALTDFPFYVNVTYDADMKTDFTDVRFVSGQCNVNGNELAQELDYKTNSVSAGFWIKNNLTIGQNNFSMYYGNSGASSASNGKNVWTNGFVAVYHFSECTGLTVADSLGNYNGTIRGSLAWNTTSTTLGCSMKGNGTQSNNVQVNHSSALNIDSNSSFEMLIRSDSQTSNYAGMGKAGLSYAGYEFVYSSTNGYGVYTEVLNGNSVSHPSNNVWSGAYVVNDGINIYTYGSYGVLAQTSAKSAVAVSTVANITIGARSLPLALAEGINGLYDEVRIQNLPRSAHWINRTYNNLDMSYVSFGAEESGGGSSDTMTVTNSIPLNNSNTTSSTVVFACNTTSTGTNNITSVTLAVSGTSVWNQTVSGLNTQSYNASFTNSTLSDGTFTWLCYAYGSTTNGTSQLWTLNKDATSPVMAYGTGTETSGTTLTRANIVINITSIDTNLKNLSIFLYNSTYHLQNVTSSATSPLWRNYSGLRNDTYYFNATSQDTFNNNASLTTRTIVINTGIPIVNITYPITNTNYSSYVTHIDFNITSAPSLNRCEYSLDNGITNTTFPCSIGVNSSITGLPSTEGIKNWKFYVYTNSSTNSVNNLDFIVNLTKVSLDSPANNGKSYSSPTNFYCSAYANAPLSIVNTTLWVNGILADGQTPSTSVYSSSTGFTVSGTALVTEQQGLQFIAVQNMTLSNVTLISSGTMPTRVIITDTNGSSKTATVSGLVAILDFAIAKDHNYNLVADNNGATFNRTDDSTPNYPIANSWINITTGISNGIASNLYGHMFDSFGFTNSSWVLSKTLTSTSNWTCQTCDSSNTCVYANENRTIIPYYISTNTTQSSMVSENELSNYTLTINMTGISSWTSNAKLYFNGVYITDGTPTITANATIFNATINVPSYNTNPSNWTWSYNISGSSADAPNVNWVNVSGTQAINTFLFSICTSAINNTYINYTFKDETSLAILNASISSSSWSYYFNGSTIKTYNYQNVTENPSYAFCFTPPDRILYLNYSIQYTSTGYIPRTYSVSNSILTNATTNQILYLESSTTGIYARFVTLTSAGGILSGVNIIITRNIGGNTVTIGQGTSDSSGLFTIFLDPTVSYNFIATKSGYVDNSFTLTPNNNQNYNIYMASTSSSSLIPNSSTIASNLSTVITPLNSTLQNNTVYNFGFNVSGNGIIYISFNITNSSGQQQGFASGTNGFISTNINTLNNTFLIGTYLVSTLTENFSYTHTWSVGNYYAGSYSLYVLMKGWDSYGFKYEYFRVLFMLLTLFIAIGGLSKLEVTDTSESKIWMGVFIVWIFSYVGWLTIPILTNPASPLYNVQQFASQYTIALISTVASFLVVKEVIT